ncbi:8-amino-7-oxononanoate synthase [Silanimonas sp.]|uniref:8-amino-7-oxononanoate synthase n=1 Tax=Silanimonas sp. TaxID=1929290 RepID=UPI001BC41938|nr:8-amino-7-oxononanoate synthase [Silanimonas sp.]MBS3896952.1 8-amino-7-oxononanoate synthase [Silanimonas sp.]MBS3923792.1 8-amino-7-oxononanoate synthase [Xanthomonadaceae bacterium]
MLRPCWDERLAAAAVRREGEQASRRRRRVEQVEGRRVRVEGRELLNFCSNDYLGLAASPAGVAALQQAAAQHGLGSAGSALVCGHHALHARFEREAAEWLAYERALFLPSGYQANLMVLQGLLTAGDLCVQDKLNHACLIDGARLAGAELRRYRHADTEAALRQLQARPEALALLASDSVFSMDGDLAPLRALAGIAADEQALLLIDEAHGVGVFGPEGRGACAAAGLSAQQVPVLTVPLGKAFGAQGALVLGEAALIDHLLQSARPYLFSTAALPALAAALSANLHSLRQADDRREQLQQRVRHFREGAKRRGLPVLDSTSPIQPLLLGANARALALAAALEERGYWVSAIRPPSVPTGQARLRITLTVQHRHADIDGLLDALAASLDTLGTGP